jgi:hypothetical protein
MRTLPGHGTYSNYVEGLTPLAHITKEDAETILEYHVYTVWADWLKGDSVESHEVKMFNKSWTVLELRGDQFIILGLNDEKYRLYTASYSALEKEAKKGLHRKEGPPSLQKRIDALVDEAGWAADEVAKEMP